MFLLTVFFIRFAITNPSLSWLSISLEAAFGSKTNVFCLHKPPTQSSNKKNLEKNISISIHPQASSFVCGNVLDILIFLAKTFPEQFVTFTFGNCSVPLKSLTSAPGFTPLKDSKDAQQPTTPQAEPPISNKPLPSFFNILIKHDVSNSGTKKKSSKHSKFLFSSERSKFHDFLGSSSLNTSLSSLESENVVSKWESPFTQLLNLLSHQFIKKSSSLTDRLIKLLNYVVFPLSIHPEARTSINAPAAANQPGAGPPPNNSTSSTDFQTAVPGSTLAVNLMRAKQDGKYNEVVKSVANEQLLELVVNVLISNSCTDEGLVDASSLLIKLSTIFPDCRTIFNKLLLNGVRQLGQNVLSDISALHVELARFLSVSETSSSKQDEASVSGESENKSKKSFRDRFTKQNIVINSPAVAKAKIAGKEVQLPSMSTLISKSSSQFLFLRILKIIIHIRDIAAKLKKQTAASSSAPAASSTQPPEDLSSAPVEPALIPNAEATTPASPTEASPSGETNMEVDKEEDKLSVELALDHLWDKLSDCLCLLSDAPDDHAVLVLQPAVEAFFLVHAPEKSKRTDSNRPAAEPITNQMSHLNQSVTESMHSDSGHLEPGPDKALQGTLPVDTEKFLAFAEKHKLVLNQILRQSNVHLANGPFAVLVDHTRILDFDVKRRYFRHELERLDHNSRRDDITVHIRRDNIFEDSYRELNRRPSEEWKNRFYIVFENEEGQDAGGLLREWYTIISREIFNPNYALFCTSPGDRVTYMINSSSHFNSNHLSYFKFVGRVIAKAVYDNKLLDCYFTRSFYKHILGKLVKYTDMESEDYAFYQGLVFLLEHNVDELGTELTFSLEVQEFGVNDTRDLKPNGRNLLVTEENKYEYVKLVCQEKMTGSIKKQLSSFLEGFYEIIPKRLISIFNEQELELLISGLPNIDIDDLKANSEYHKYQVSSLQIQWFWRALRSFDQADRAKFLQFVTGTSKVPLQGFSALEGMNGAQKFQIHLDDRSTDRLPSAHTW